MEDLMEQSVNKISSVYIHIPFCNTICSYCDFCKFLKNNDWINKYLIALKKEIVKRYKKEKINTLYIGGGTPSCLDIKSLKKLFSIINLIKLNNNYEFTFECNIEDITKEKLELLYNNGVNRLSIGVQSFNDKNLKFLNRNHKRQDVFDKIQLAKKTGFNNINIDLIYAIPGETIKQLSDDIDDFIKLDINHISTYSLIIEPNTRLYIEKVSNIDQDLDYEMYKLICKKLSEHNFKHYEISNFAKDGYESKHNLTYWNNLRYYGFGLGASGYIDDIRYDNTRSFKSYLEGNYVINSNKLSKNEQIENEFILGLRKIEGINKKDFYNKYNIKLNEIDVVNKLLAENKLLENQENIYINKKNIYTSNDILVEFIN